MATHSFARDRAPVDCPIRITTWRYRWNCGCGEVGDWRRSETWARHGWIQHTLRKTQMEGRAS